MGWVKEHLARDRKVRGIIISASGDAKLKSALKVVPSVSLYVYNISFSHKRKCRITMSRGARKPRPKQRHRELYELLNDAQASFVWSEYARAAKLYEQALEQAGPNAEASVLADILEGRERVQRAIEETERDLPDVIAAANANPEDTGTHFYLAVKLSALGRKDEALVEYKAALENPEKLCADCFRHLWNNIGWYYFRQGEYREALKWFDQAYVVATFDEASGKGSCALPMENRMLAFAELGMRKEAEETIREYISRYGRIPWPERRALSKLNLDADAIYVESISRK